MGLKYITINKKAIIKPVISFLGINQKTCHLQDLDRLYIDSASRIIA